MILESVENGPLIWPTIEENGVTRTKKYAALSAAEKIQADYDIEATNIILQCLPADIYSLVNHHRVAKDLWERVQILMQSTSLTKQERECKLYVLLFLYSLQEMTQQGNGFSNSCSFLKGRQGQSYSGSGYKINATSSGGNNASGQAKTEDLDTYDFDCDDISNAKAVLMANISNYGYDVISEEKANKEHNSKSVTAELERYKERVKTFEQRLNIDLSYREKMIDSQMDDMIKKKLALKEQVDSLEQKLSKQIKEKELGQSAQTVHMLTKPQVFYDNIHKQALGYQNPFYLKKVQRIKPTLYDGIVISAKHVAMHVIDDEETLILEKESRSKMSEKEKDPEAIKQNISHKPIDYEKLNRLSDDFRKRFTPQQELSAEQAFWLRMSNPTIKPSDASPVKIEAPKELPKVFKEQFDSIKKTRVRTKEQSDSLIDKMNLKSAENEDLKAQIQDKVFVITSLKNDLRKVKGKEIVDIAAQIPSANTIVPGIAKKVAVTPKNKVKKVRFDESLTSSSNIKQVESSTTSDSNTPVLSPTGLKCSTSCTDSSLVSGLQMFKTYDREPLSAHELSCALEKSKKSSNQPKSEDTNQEKLYLLHMDLCSPMRVASIKGKRYILVIVDDYSRFTWVRFLRTKDEALEAIIKCIKNIQVRLNAIVRNVRTDNGTEFLMQDKKSDLSFFHVFGALCYPTNENDDLGKLDAKADIGPELHSMTPATSSSGLVPNPISQQPSILPPRDDWDCLFQPMFNEYFTPPSIAVSPV
ncbi:integrase, catalytic region, zinc finger, CCHC-type containing protein [Tanacetum coccineum]